MWAVPECLAAAAILAPGIAQRLAANCHCLAEIEFKISFEVL